MTEALGPITYVVALLVTAALFLWLVEGVAKLIGGRNTGLFFLGFIPFVVGLVYSLHNGAHLAWWQRLLYPLAGPVLAVALLLLAFAAFNPVDAVLLVGGMLRRAWCFSTGKNRRAPRETRERQGPY